MAGRPQTAMGRAGRLAGSLTALLLTVGLVAGGLYLYTNFAAVKAQIDAAPRQSPLARVAAQLGGPPGEDQRRARASFGMPGHAFEIGAETLVSDRHRHGCGSHAGVIGPVD